MTGPAPRPDPADGSAEIRWEDFAALWSRVGARIGEGTRRRKANLAVALWCAALFVVFLTWNGAAGRTSVAAQLPYLVSGGLAALVLTIGGSALFLLGVVEEARTAPEPVEEPV